MLVSDACRQLCWRLTPVDSFVCVLRLETVVLASDVCRQLCWRLTSVDSCVGV